MPDPNDAAAAETPIETAEQPDAGAAPAAPAAADPTLLDDTGAGEGKEQAPAAAFPDDWREKLAAGNKDALKLLSFVSSPAALTKKLMEQEKTIKSGAHKKPLPDDATPEQIAEYRKAAGIPETSEGYHDQLDGLVIGEQDKPVIEGFLKEMHGAHASPKHVKAALDFYYKRQEAQVAETAEQDNAYLGEQRQIMAEAMGGDFRANMNDLKAFLGQREGMLEEFMQARGANGRPLMSNAGVVGWLVEQMRELNPLQTVVPGSGDGAAKSLNDEIAAIEKVQRDDNPAYWRDEKMQTRYRELLTAREKLTARAG